MKTGSSTKRRDPFPFVLEELSPIRPTIKHWFGFTSVYLDEKLLCSLRDSANFISDVGTGIAHAEHQHTLSGKLGT